VGQHVDLGEYSNIFSNNRGEICGDGVEPVLLLSPTTVEARGDKVMSTCWELKLASTGWIFIIEATILLSEMYPW
jgi:hypothetical protein